MTAPSAKDYSYTQNRELSWLRFNERVLEEALDPTVPIFERLKFVSIFTSNLDEFFMIRVGSLTDVLLVKDTVVDSKSGLSPAEQLDRIYDEVARLSIRKDEIFHTVTQLLREANFVNLCDADLVGTERKTVDQYFQSYVKPVLSPQIIGSHHPFPHIENLSIHIAVRLQKNQNIIYGLIPVPKYLPRIFYTDPSNTRFVLMEQIILMHVEEIFDQFTVLDKSIIVVTRNADINTDEGLLDEDIDYRMHMKKILKKRARLSPVRLEYSPSISKQTLQFFLQQLGLTNKNSYRMESPIDMSFVFSLEGKLPKALARTYLYLPHKPLTIVPKEPGERVSDLVAKKDILLQYPYEDIDLFLQLIKEAAEDPHVISIHITIYRLARNSKLVEYLSKASENGKDVIALMELRARFDEENNINWSESLMESGVKVFYGFDDYKAHSKVCLITSIEDNKLLYTTQIGTGNYNESTSKQYTDLSLITRDQRIGQDASEFFKDMMIGTLEGRYDHLIASPYTLKDTVIDLIDEQIRLAEDGEPALLTFKLNSLTDRNIIDKLAEASQAGVQVNMIIRGICCLLPGVPGKTENIHIRSIVGRFLEHSRIYAFGSGETAKIYISSADFMTRNTEKRVEIATPIYDPDAKAKIFDILDIELRDNVKARVMQPDGTYRPVESVEPPLNSQTFEMVRAQKTKAELDARAEETAKAQAKAAALTPPEVRQEQTQRTWWQKLLDRFRG